MAGKGISKGAMWVLMGLLIVGLGGFGVTNLSGNVRSVGSVGDAEIDVNTYARALQNEIRALEAQRGESVSFAQARAAGVDQQVLGQLVSRAALEHETARLGISVGDATLRDEILAMSAFSGLDGSFDRESYAFALQQAGLNEAEFEENIRAETAATLLQAAAVAGMQVPPAYMDAMMTYLGERRSLAFATLDRGDLQSGLPVPSEEDLRSYHQSHLPDFTTPETKSITYAWVTPEMIVDTVEVPEDALRRAYDERSAEFNQPERRLVERLVYSDPERAERAMTRLDDGVLFEMLVAERGLEMADVDMGDVSDDDLGPAAEAVFAADSGEIVGPIETSLGPALFRINGVLAAQVTSFEEAKAQLRETLARDRAGRVIDTMSERVDDLLAGGATLEDVVRETELELGEIDWHPDLAEGIAGYAAFRSAAEAVQDGDYPAVERTEDDGIFALRLDGIEEPRIQPLDDVREAVRQGWRQEATVDALAEQVAPQVAELSDGASFDDLGLEASEITDMTRRDYRADAPPEFIEQVFAMEEGEVQVIEGVGRIFLLRLDAVAPPAEDDEDMTRLRTALRDQVAADFGQDIFQLLADDIRARAGVELDQSALNAVHANFN
ncbi:Peptidyl-prolyl cis-trans isomerase D [Roseovarius tolerans]|uniref:Parvulin-like PPIase n=1 Tax=Roseovarius tolerans TaxID=74031 RepID=A0A0L6CYK1_9RHOB|nr:peptidyl-prolyl cis-trans isomerase [Roseovarius tolerans]KNX42765.1 Peptidyl-prolyl cis-trans isomerase D [Roseovarius tolerans]